MDLVSNHVKFHMDIGRLSQLTCYECFSVDDIAHSLMCKAGDNYLQYLYFKPIVDAIELNVRLYYVSIPGKSILYGSDILAFCCNYLVWYTPFWSVQLKPGGTTQLIKSP